MSATIRRTIAGEARIARMRVTRRDGRVETLDPATGRVLKVEHPDGRVDRWGYIEHALRRAWRGVRRRAWEGFD